MNQPKLTTLYGMDIPDLEAGQTARIVCPQCRGGSTHERSMIVSRDHWAIGWYCFRANCGEKGRQIIPGGVVDDTELEPTEKRPRPYTGDVFALSKLQQAHFQEKYNLSAGRISESIYRSHEHWPDDFRYILPIKRHDGVIRGHVARIPWGEPSGGHAKSMTYWNEEGPLLSWYHPRYRCTNRDVLVVEDQLSAMRAAEHLNLVACAILGTGLNAEKVQELQKHTHYLTIALDADATGQAFAMARKWGQAFANCKVLVLSQDIKDMSLKDLTNLNI